MSNLGGRRSVVLGVFAGIVALGSLGFHETARREPAARPAAAVDCASGDALCLGEGRFLVQATWTAPDGSSGAAHPVALTGDSGYFWFFDPDNVELAIKVLNGCGINARYWVFAGGLTNLKLDITVTDTQTGVVKNYANPQGQAFQPILDAAALETCTAAAVAESSGLHPEEPLAESARLSKAPTESRSASDIGCTESDTVLCLDGRFAVDATWETAGGAAGAAMAVSLSRNSGYFWFFEPTNVELIVKRLDACAIGQGQWFFGAGMTDVGVELHVTDTYTGEVKTYSSSTGTPFAPIQDTGAFAFCPTPTPTPTPTLTPTPTRTATRKPRTHSPTSTPTSTPRPPAHVVKIGICGGEFGKFPCFLPFTLHVRRGDEVEWTWTGTHSTTSGPCFPTKVLGSNCAADGRWDSGNRTASGVAFSRRFDQVGTFHYFCRIGFFSGRSHEQGQIIVDP